MRISDWSSDVCSSDLRARPSWRARRRQCRSSNCARIEMAGFLDGDLTTIALCWRLERRDGVTIGLTTHDRDLMIGGLLHRAAPGMTPSAIERSEGLDPDTMDVAGALTRGAIREDRKSTRLNSSH